MAFKLKREELALLPAGRAPIKILHFSDLHLSERRRSYLEFIKSWRDLKPDLVISTGDYIASNEAIPLLTDALGPLLEIPGAFVFGSNDYYGPKLKNPIRYLLPDRGRRIHGPQLAWQELEEGLSKFGWINLMENRTEIRLGEITIELRGTSDAHHNMDRYEVVQGKKGSVDLTIGVTHAPYQRILDAMAEDKIDLIFAGHTHGGQIRLPWFGESKSLTTNCDLPNWRSRGLTKINNQPWLHVSAGVGSNPFTPIRIFCPSEATLLTLTSPS